MTHADRKTQRDTEQSDIPISRSAKRWTQSLSHEQMSSNLKIDMCKAWFMQWSYFCLAHKFYFENMDRLMQSCKATNTSPVVNDIDLKYVLMTFCVATQDERHSAHC